MSFLGDIAGGLLFDPLKGLWEDVTGVTGQREALAAAQEGQQAATAEQRELLEQGYGRARGIMSPYYTGGMGAYNQLLAQMGMGDAEAMDYMKSPMAQAMQQQFQRQKAQSMEEIKNLMAGQGMLYSGDTSRAMGDYMAKYTPDYYGAFMGNLGSLAQTGMGAASNLANLATGQAGTMGNLLQQAAQMQAGYGLQEGNLGAQSFQNLLNTAQQVAPMMMGMPPMPDGGFLSNMGTAFSNMFGAPGTNQASYTGDAYSDWVNQQQSGATMGGYSPAVIANWTGGV